MSEPKAITMEEVLSAAGVGIESYKPKNAKCYILYGGRACTMPMLCEEIVRGLGAKIVSFAELAPSLIESRDITSILTPYIETKFSKKPPEFKGRLLGTDVETGEHFVFTKEDGPIGIDAVTYASGLGIKESDILSVSERMLRRYSPFTPEVIFQSTDKNIDYPVLNTYTVPLWTKSYTSSRADITLFIKLVNHLIKLDEEREYFFAWVKTAITSRAYTYLILSGLGGTGKNVLKEVLRGIFGHLNVTDGKISTITSNFNGQLVNTRLLWGDEWQWGTNEEFRLKEIQNDRISIEKKGVDATTSTQIYCSLVLTNNSSENNKVPFESRKFVPLVLGDSNLATVMTSEEIEELKNKVNQHGPFYDPDFIASIHDYILQQGKPENYRNLEYKGPGFYRMANLNMSKWSRTLIEALYFIFASPPGFIPPERMFKKKEYTMLRSKMTYGTLTIKNLLHHLDLSTRNIGTNNFPGSPKIHTFLNDYRDVNGQKIFDIGPITGVASDDFTIKYLTRPEDAL